MAKIQKPAAAFQEHLQEQVGFLRASCIAFDRGDLSEAKRLAVAVRVLVHDTSSSTSLLMHLGKKNIQFLNTAGDHPADLLAGWTGLLGIALSAEEGSSYVPHYDPPPGGMHWTRWVDWWHAVVLDMQSHPLPPTGNPNPLQRRDIVLTLADQEGGAHVDSGTEPSFTTIARSPGLDFKAVRIHPGGPTELKNADKAELFSMRQIAHEVIRSLENASLCPSVDLPTPQEPRAAVFGAFYITRS